MAKKQKMGAATAPIVYTVREPLRHDGDEYQIGDQISLSADAALPLIAAGVLSSPAPDLTVSTD